MLVTKVLRSPRHGPALKILMFSWDTGFSWASPTVLQDGGWMPKWAHMPQALTAGKTTWPEYVRKLFLEPLEFELVIE